MLFFRLPHNFPARDKSKLLQVLGVVHTKYNLEKVDQAVVAFLKDIPLFVKSLLSKGYGKNI